MTSVLTWREHGMRGDLFPLLRFIPEHLLSSGCLTWQVGQSYMWGVHDEDYFSADTRMTSPRVRQGERKHQRLSPLTGT